MRPVTDGEDAFDILASDHRTILDLIAAATAAESPEDAEGHCEQLVMAVVRHFVAEEQYLLPLVREHLDDGESHSDAAFAEHASVEQELRRLEDLEDDPDERRVILGDIGAMIGAHVDHQESQLFPLLRESVAADTLTTMADEILGAEELAPTRPRSVRPRSAAVNKFVSLVSGYVDHVRDSYSHRGVDEDEAAEHTRGADS